MKSWLHWLAHSGPLLFVIAGLGCGRATQNEEVNLGSRVEMVEEGVAVKELGEGPPGVAPMGDVVFVENAGFYIDRFEVTTALFSEFLSAMGNRTEGGMRWIETASKFARIEESDGRFVAEPGYENEPVVEVSWHGARAYCAWANKRLPTSEEWRQACSGDQGWRYPWGEEFVPGRANIAGAQDGFVGAAPVGSFPAGASPSGALDMAGNVWEWTAADSITAAYSSGGSWSNSVVHARCASRASTVSDHAGILGNSVGFRCAR